MQRIRTLGLALIAVLALSAVAVSSASASSFLAHPKVAGLEGLKTLDINVGNHKFKTGSGFSIECTSAKSEGDAANLKGLTTIEKVSYAGCTVLGVFTATVSTAEYEFSADLKVTQKNTVVITVKAFSTCFVVVSPTGNSNLNSVHYANQGQDLKVNAAVKGISAFVSGGECGESGTNKEAEYTGESRAWLESGGRLGWDKE